MAEFDEDSRPSSPGDAKDERVPRMKKFQAWLALGMITLGLALLGSAPAAAQEKTPPGEKAVHSSGMFGDAGLKGIGAGIGAGLVIMGGAAGIGRIGGSAVESMARQPEASGSINFAMILTAAMIEGATLFAVVVCLLAIVL